jgi:16S rRNA (cytosine967-C5)-methyltransferase
MSDSSWSWAAELMSRFLKKPARLQHLLERLPSVMDPGTRRRCQFLLYGTVRHWTFLEEGLDEWLKKRPRVGLRAALLVATFEIMTDPEKGPQIVDHAVRGIGKKYSKSERGLANAVLRKVSTRMSERLSAIPTDAATIAVRHSHPRWMIDRWEQEFGFDGALRMAEWNQREPDLYAFSLKEGAPLEIGEASRWERYSNVTNEARPAVQEQLDAATIYIQNPGARLAPEMLAKFFEVGRVLDMCAAPGGKSLYLDKTLGDAASEIVAFDLAGSRLERLKSNMSQFGSKRIRVMAGDLFELDVKSTGSFEAVFLDAPCANTGVMQRKPDVKWRLVKEDWEKLTALQERMLEKAASLVGEQGLLLYSTCSIDGDENEGVIDRFLSSATGQAFERLECSTSLPWESGHDGSGACALRRR